MRERLLQPEGFQASRPVDDWQRHAPFLRRLARGLLEDPSAADDAVQEAWLAVNRRSKSRARIGERAWLGGVVRNTVGRFRRSEARRHAREERAARQESLPSASDTVARLEVLRRVVDAVRELEEPYGTVLLLRFLDELSPSEIADRQGVSVETVRTQVRRGLDRLRSRLSAQAGDDDGSWLAALLPFAGPTGPAAGVAPSSFLTQVALMSFKTKLVVAAGLLAIAGLGAWWNWGPDGPAPAEVGPGVELAQESVGARAGSSPRSSEVVLDAAEEGRVAASVAAHSWAVAGRALRGEQPFPGLQLEVRVWEGATLEAIRTDRSPERVVEVTTDEDGSFSAPFEDVTGSAVVIVRPTGVFADGLEYSWRAARLEIAAGTTPQRVELSLHWLDALLVGTVRDMEGRPIPGAQVRTGAPWVTADADGRFRHAIRARSQTYFYAQAEGYAQARQILSEIVSGQELQVDFELKDEFRVEGAVRDLHGGPVQGARVTSFFTTENDVLTDASGRYALGHLDPGRPKHMLHASKEGWVTTQVDVFTEADGAAERDFTLDRGVRVTGRVVDRSGAPVAGAALYIGFSAHAFNRLDAVSGEDGSFLFPSVQRETVNLVVERKAFAPHSQVLDVPKDRDFLSGLEVVLEDGHFLGGHVVDAGGEPLAGIWVSVRYLGEHLETRGETDEAGSFHIEDLPAADLQLSFYAPGRALQRVEHDVAAVDVDDLRITLPPAGGIAGRVVDGRTGRPIESFRVRFVDPELQAGEERLWGYSASWSREGLLFESRDGVWSTGDETDLVPGRVVGVEVRAAGYAPASDRHVVAALDADPDNLVLALFPGVAISGTVLTAGEGRSVEGAMLKLYRPGERISLLLSDDTHGRPLARADSLGEFRFEGVAPGEHRILVHSDAHPVQVDGPFEVPSEGSVRRLIELKPAGVVTGTLRGLEGEPRANAEIEMVLERAAEGGVSRNWTVATDDAGDYRIEGVPGGSFRIGPRIGEHGRGIAEYFARVELAPGEERRVDLEPPGTATLVGWVVADGALPELVPVQLVEASGAAGVPLAPFGGLVRDGTFELRGLAAGTYAVSLFWRDALTRTLWRSTESVEVVLEAGRTSDVRLEVRGTPY